MVKKRLGEGDSIIDRIKGRGKWWEREILKEGERERERKRERERERERERDRERDRERGILE